MLLNSVPLEPLLELVYHYCSSGALSPFLADDYFPTLQALSVGFSFWMESSMAAWLLGLSEIMSCSWLLCYLHYWLAFLAEFWLTNLSSLGSYWQACCLLSVLAFYYTVSRYIYSHNSSTFSAFLFWLWFCSLSRYAVYWQRGGLL